MDKLIEIAKECGANSYTDCNVTLRGENICLSPDQLRAYTEKVCAPLVEALENYRESEMNGLGAVFNTPAKETLAAYTEIMGDKK